MRKARVVIGMGALAVIATAAAAATTTTRMTIQAESRISVDGNSSVRRYSCEAATIRGGLTVEPASATASLAEMGRAVKGVDLAIPVAGLDCGDRTMNGHMRKALLATEAPEIRYRLTTHQVTPTGSGTVTVQMSGVLSIAGTDKPITMTAELRSEAGGQVRVTGSREIRMTEWGVKPPSLMMGAMKVHDPVTVKFDLLLKP
jgi:polyisoprenoid-binding protein YceI